MDKLEKPDLESSASALCNDDQVQLSFQPHPSSSWKWFDGENQIIDAPSGATLMTTREGFYYLEVSKHSCTVYSDTIELKLQEDSLYVPNVFTPNGDEKNNEFRIMANQLEDFSVSIFDRDGTPVFQSNDPDFAWRGDNRAPGVYFWQIHYRNCFNERKQYKGWVDLRR